MPALRAHSNPLQFALQGPLPFALAFFFPLEPGALLFQPGGVVALPGDALPPIQFQDPLRHIVQEVAVVGDGDHGAGIVLEMVLHPGHGLGVQVVGRFVQEQDVRLLEQEPAQGNSAPFPSGENLDRRVSGWAPKSVHSHLKPGVEIPGVHGIDLFLDLALPLDELVHLFVRHGFREFLTDAIELVEQIHDRLHAFFNDLFDRLGVVELRFLFEKPYRITWRKNGLPVEFLVHPGKDPEQGTLARAVEAQHADLRSVEIGDGDVLENRFFVVVPAHPDHGVDDFVRFRSHRI